MSKSGRGETRLIDQLVAPLGHELFLATHLFPLVRDAKAKGTLTKCLPVAPTRRLLACPCSRQAEQGQCLGGDYAEGVRP